jgi:hypothetical protein
MRLMTNAPCPSIGIGRGGRRLRQNGEFFQDGFGFQQRCCAYQKLRMRRKG